ncbi:hypothetical protein FRAAL5725 [Frankia alni ACN14a]|uniref:Uncharacterized protein n=1 Tax=Frankia alni (strain DSM 45986 / CECT 9034 / ACN14a) TaxID=326424 RepID=Q0RDV9_FRAAA|nr:hypothetical protein FRAAL5725 [Frankia alni ACN14a]
MRASTGRTAMRLGLLCPLSAKQRTLDKPDITHPLLGKPVPTSPYTRDGRPTCTHRTLHGPGTDAPLPEQHHQTVAKCQETQENGVL